MEQATRAEVESIDSNLDQNTFGKLVQTNYNYIMAEINQKDVDYNEPNSRGDGNQSFYHDNPAAVDSSLFVLDCVGNKTLKDSLGQNNNGSMSISNEVGSYDDDAAITNDNLELLNKSHLNSNDDDDQQDESEEIKTKTKEEGRVISNRQRKRNTGYCLSSSIDTHLDKLLQKKPSSSSSSNNNVDKLLKTIKPAADPTSELISLRQKKKMNKINRDKVCSKKWFNMKAPELTKDVKNQLSIIQLRNILDQKNFYKNNDRKRFPKFFQMGKVVESACDFYHSRIPKKQRKASLLEEVMADADLKKYQKRKYAEIFGNAKSKKKQKRRKFVAKETE